MKKFLFLAIALVMSVSAWADAYDFGTQVIKEVKACTQTIESGKWYVISNVRKDGGNYATPTPVYDQGAGLSLKREPHGQTVRTILTVGKSASEVAKYLVRFSDHEEISGTKCAQYGTGNYVAPLSANDDGTNVTTSSIDAAGLQIYGATQTRYSNAGSPYTNAGVGFNFSTGAGNYGKRWDGNGANYSVLVWGAGQITSDANNVWYVEEVVLEAPGVHTYTINVEGAPQEATIVVSVKGALRAIGEPIEYATSVDPSDVSATAIPFYDQAITVEGETITITYTPWPDYKHNSAFDTPHTNAQRQISKIKLGDQEIDINGAGNIYQDLTATATFTIEAGQDVKPAIIWNGAWMHGYVFVDTNSSDRQFTVEELVSSAGMPSPERNVLLESEFGTFHIDDAGTYRMRYMVAWNSTDPIGPNTIVENSGYMLDVNLEVVSASVENTYSITFNNAPAGAKVTYKETEYGYMEQITITGVFNPAELSATPREGYHVEYEIDGEYLRVNYIKNTFPQEGTYWVTIENKEIERKPFLFNSTEYSDGITLQGATDEHATVNGYIWEVTTDAEMHITAIKNAETGKGIKATGNCTGEMTTFTLTNGVNSGYYNMINTTQISGGGHDRLNCASSDSYHNEANLRAVTTWTGAHADNDWKFNAIEPGLTFHYNIAVTGLPAGTVGYAIYNGMRAADGGFFLSNGYIGSGVTAKDVAGYSYEVNYGNPTITVTYTQTATPVDVTYDIYVGDTKVGEKVISEYVGEGQHIMDWFAAQSAVEYVMVNSLHGDPVTAENATTHIPVNTSYRPNMPFQTDGTLYTLALNRTPNLQIYVTGETINTMATTNANYTAPTYANQANYNWAIEGDWFNGFTLKNMGANKYVTFGSLAPSGDKPAATLVETPAEGGHFELRIKNTNQYYFRIMGTTNAAYISNNGGATTTYLTTWNNENNFNQSDAGAQFVFGTALDIPEGNDWSAFETKLNLLKEYSFGTKLGQYADVDLSGEFYGSTTASVMIGYYGDDLNARDDDYYESDMEQMDYILSHLQLNMPEVGQMFRIKASNKHIPTATYMKGSNNEENSRTAFTQDNDEIAGASTIFCYFQEGEGKYLSCYENGITAGRISNTNNFMTMSYFPSTTAIAFQAASNGTKGMYNIKFAGSRFLYTNNNLYADAGSSSNDEGYNFELEEVTTLPVTFKEAGLGYATFCAPVAVTIPAGVDAYVVTTDNENYLSAESVTGSIAAGTPVVLHKSEGSAATLSVAEEGTSHNSNLLSGTYYTKNTVEGSFVFSIADSAPGFYSFEGAKLLGFKAYFKPEVANVNGYKLDFDGMLTGIKGLQTSAPAKAAFDLQGRRVNAATRGLFIQNGAKVIR